MKIENNKMRKIFTIGETVFDIIFKNSKPVAGRAGGAMLNSSICLGRLGVPVFFISEIGKDEVGNIIIDFLKQNKVNTEHIYKLSGGNTALAMAFLDKNENADYTFYKQYPEKRLGTNFPEVQENDIVLFGSFFAITKEVRDKLMKFINTAKSNGAIVLYDPNFRKFHLKDLPFVKKYITENIFNSSIVRGSDEDFKLIFNTDNPRDTFNIIRNNGCKILIYTSGDKNVQFVTEVIKLSIPVKKIKPVSTIGAGDTFNAGIIYGLYKNQINTSELYKVDFGLWKTIIQTAITFGTHVCQSFDNYLSVEFARTINN